MSEEYGFGLDWRYHKGDLEHGGEYPAGDFDKDWQYVNIPHCTSYVTPDEFHAYEGVSWYSKHFVPSEELKDKCVFVRFDAVMQSAAVFLNGERLAYHEGGYMGFVVWLTGKLIFGQDNILTVRSDSNGSPDFAPTANKGIDFQYHGGIYRPVHLIYKEKVFITDELFEEETAGGGVFVRNTTLDMAGRSAELSVKTHVRNASPKERFDGRICVQVSDKNGSVAACGNADISLLPEEAKHTEVMLCVPEVNFWSINSPYLYSISVKLYDGDRLVDQTELNYGIRSIRWQKDGLYINEEKQSSLHGVNYHQDIFGVGNAMTKAAIYNDVRLIKAAGLDFVRCSHYPHSRHFYDACDEMGIVCLNSMTGWQVFVDSEAFKQNTVHELRQLIRRDRNHACVAAWESSINEAGFTHEWGQAAHDAAHEEYPGCYTAAWKNGGDGAYPDIFLCAAQHGSKIYASRTAKPVIISEYGDWNFGGTKSTSRQERGDGDKAMLLHCNNLEESLVDNEAQMQAGEVAADAYWDFADYSPFSSEPSVIKCGLVDMYRIPKHGYYLYRSQKDAPMLYVANGGNGDSPADIRIYSSCEQVELFVNGRSYGIRKPEKSNCTDNGREETGLKYEKHRVYSYETLRHPPFIFRLDKYEPGEMRAVGYIGGRPAAEQIIRTPGEAAAIRLICADDRVLNGDGVDEVLVYAEITDCSGVIVPVNKYALAVRVSGSAQLIGPDTVYTSGGIAAFWVRSSRKGTGSAKIEVRGTEAANNVTAGSGYHRACAAVGLRPLTGELLISVTADERLKPEPDNFSWWEAPHNVTGAAADVAREKPAYASGCAEESKPEYGNSGNPGLWWRAAVNKPGEWWLVDTGAVYDFSSVNIVWPKAHPYRYLLEVSCSREAAADWSVLKDCTDNNAALINTNDIVCGRGRYIRITITGNVSDEAPVSFNMFSAYGKAHI